jgi:hypothetical protein
MPFKRSNWSPVDAWLDSTIIGIQALVMEIETSGGAVGGQA